MGDGIERLREAGVPVVQGEFCSGSGVLQIHEQVPGLLDAPGLDRVRGGARGLRRPRLAFLPVTASLQTECDIPWSALSCVTRRFRPSRSTG